MSMTLPEALDIINRHLIPFPPGTTVGEFAPLAEAIRVVLGSYGVSPSSPPSGDPKKFTNAQFARWLGTVGRKIAGATAMQADGMWNPQFCSAEAGAYAASICEDLESQLKWLRARLSDGAERVQLGNSGTNQ